MSANLFNEPPPQNQPPLNPDGSINPIWFLWFYNLFQASSALVDLQILESFDGGLSDQSLSAAERAEVSQAASIEGGPPPTRSNVEAALIAEPRDWQAPIQEAKVLAWQDPAQRRIVYTGTAALRAITPPVYGAIFFETDTQNLYVASAGVWVEVTAPGSTPGAWTAYNANPAVGGGAAATFTDPFAAYQQDGKRVYFRAFCTIKITAGATNDFLFDFPVTALMPFALGGTGQVMACSAHRNATGITEFCAAVQISGTQIALRGAANYTNGIDYNVTVEGVYEAA
jgi:hypothetical protein